MFRSLEPQAAAATILLDGRPVQLVAGANLAAALLQAGHGPFRTTPVSGAPRLPYCMMGVCFDCLAVIDGVPNRQTCLETVREGMAVDRQQGAA
ncbi:2Fe-2S iron-sulfur cluster-binding protein [Gemmobacter sp.]|uniref:2Fe-2S iron-sulfur cluster-binding protein n=1 Tax=Gemmobacter sp. TaxID=1898957 RepID=UPI002AFE6698|nr:2Fe-2S iron-sulfur cluster-binding protein [Gemmobacter sp.]